VTDTGVGISEENREKIFDRFYQVSGETGSQSQGVGVGLALARELVEQHRGKLTVTSEVGKGSTFCLDLPASANQKEPVPLLEASKEGSGDVEPFRDIFRSADRTFVNREVEGIDEVRVVGSGKFTLLVVEDEPDVLEYISGFLREKHRVVLVREGSQVEALVEEFNPDLLLLDWMLPGRDGLSICRDLRQDPAHADRKVVILTARVDEESKMEALKAGADDFLLKPFSSLELQVRIDNLLQSGELQKRLRERNVELQETLHKLEQTEAQLIQSEKMNALGSLSAGLLHEINNPLNYAYSGVQLLEMSSEDLDEDSRETVADIREGIKRVIDVIRDLKTFAYPEKPGSHSSFTMREIVDPARKIATRELDEIEFVEEFPEDLTISGQKTQWLHVLINLFTNAGRALHEDTQNEAPRIILRAAQTSENLTISCTDNGPGIPKEIVNRIFDPFFTTREVGEGMGMGLSICRTIVENHGGSMSIQTIPGQKTTFTISIPNSPNHNDHE
ncbi:MAG: sensor histidine kinase, partial [Puniceicoccales bacterium]